MFQKGTAPFIGDYVDIAAAPHFLIDQAGKWIYNTAASTTPPVPRRAANRDVRVPLEIPTATTIRQNDHAARHLAGCAASSIRRSSCPVRPRRLAQSERLHRAHHWRAAGGIARQLEAVGSG
jgi:hypothetical protein